jgi:hypothetical protein
VVDDLAKFVAASVMSGLDVSLNQQVKYGFGF